ncbi:MAG: DUF4440 domain-containing protein [Terracidiphilus sp.]|jgi:hypothetical protein
MAGRDPFTHVDPKLLPVLEELRLREPIFHTPTFGLTAEEFLRSTAPDYWEVGASGRRYSREFILDWARKSPEHFVDASGAGWRTEDFGLLELGPETYLLTYTLDQNGRLTRRATIWRRYGDGWRILYHQGTITSGEEIDALPGG